MINHYQILIGVIHIIIPKLLKQVD